MAKIRLGQMVGQVSGSIGATTYSHGRFGPYVRLRSIPVQPGTALQLQRRADMSSNSSAWTLLTAAQRQAWKVWAENNPITDKLGDKRILDGHQAYCMLNSRLDVVGATNISNPPIANAPPSLLTLTLAASVATQLVTHTFTATPLAASHRLWCTGCKTPTATINYIKNRLRYVDKSAAAVASPWDCNNYPTICGALVLGETVFSVVSVIDTLTGLIAPPLRATCQVAA